MADTFKVITYNTHLFGGTVPGALGGLEYEDDTRKEKILNKLKAVGADIVCLQEVWADGNRQWFLDNGGSQYYSGFYPRTNDGLKISSGLLLLSRFKVGDPTFVSFKDASGIDGWATKGFFSVSVAKPTGETVAHMIVTHAQADADMESQKARKLQFGEICNFIRTNKEKSSWKNAPVILCGDFNVIGEAKGGSWPTDEYRVINDMLNDVGMTDAFRMAHPHDADPVNPGYTSDVYRNKLGRHFHPDANPKQQRLDYFYVKDQVDVLKCEVETYGWVYSNSDGLMDLSDHHPVLLEFQPK